MRFILILCLTVITSCSSFSQKPSYAIKYRQNIKNGECEKAQETIPLEKDDTQFLRFYQGSIGYLAYISLLPVTVGLDFVLMGRCQYGCRYQPDKKFLEFLFPTSTYTYESTKGMRCPDTSYYVNKILEIAECYEKRNIQVALIESLNQISYLDHEYENGPTCISVRDAQVIKETKERLTKQLAAFH